MALRPSHWLRRFTKPARTCPSTVPLYGRKIINQIEIAAGCQRTIVVGRNRSAAYISGFTLALTSSTVEVPKNVEPGDYGGKAVLTCEGILIAKRPMVIKVGVKRTLVASLQWQAASSTEVSMKPFVPKTAFASYSNANCEEVLIRIHGMKKVAPNLDVFVDKIS